MKKMVLVTRRAVILIAISIIGWHLYIFISPFFDQKGLIEKGSYRELKIGASKIEIIIALRSVYSYTRIDGYYSNGELYFIPSLTRCGGDCPELLDSDDWLLIYPGFHKETISVHFSDGQVKSILYQRNAFAP